MFQGQGRVASLEDGIHIPLHRARIFKFGQLAVLRAVGGRRRRPLIEHDAQFGRRIHGAHGLHGQPVRQQQVVRHLHGGGRVGHARGELARAMAQHGRAPRLIVRGDAGDLVAKTARHLGRIGGEVIASGAIEPAPLILQGLRQVPVVQGQMGIESLGGQGVEQARIEIEAGFVPGAGTGRLHPRPGHGKTVGVHAQVGDQLHVIKVAVVMVAGHVAIAAVDDLAVRVAEGIPDGRAAAVDGGGAFDLVGAGGHAPGKGGGKVDVGIVVMHGGHVSVSGLREC